MPGWMLLIIGFVLGVLISSAIYLLTVDKYFVGNLREDKSIPEEPYYFLEIAGGRLNRLSTNNFALLRVVRENYISDKAEEKK